VGGRTRAALVAGVLRVVDAEAHRVAERVGERARAGVLQPPPVAALVRSGRAGGGAGRGADAAGVGGGRLRRRAGLAERDEDLLRAAGRRGEHRQVAGRAAVVVEAATAGAGRGRIGLVVRVDDLRAGEDGLAEAAERRRRRRRAAAGGRAVVV